MCDTFVALPSATASGSLIFAKNSDREPNEAQAVVRVERKEDKGKMLKCTFIEIPQVRETFGVVLSKPFWMWGAEMGVNEHGVAIGNEAIFTKVKFNKKQPGLTGMDLLRLALERATTAETALEIITSLLAEYGQDACGGYRDRNFYYHNSFLIADPTGAWVLETAGREWVAERVRGVRSISNGLTIGEHYDLISPNAVNFAPEYSGRAKSGKPFHFANAYSAPFLTRMSGCAVRQAMTQAAAGQSKLSVARAMEILSSHHLPDADWMPHRASTRDVAMHATGLLSPSHTVGSMVAELRIAQPATVWLTGTSSPALSVFKPVFNNGTFLNSFIEPTAHPDDSFWWQAERLFRRAATQYPAIRTLVEEHRSRLQTEFLEQEKDFFSGATPNLAAYDELSARAFAQHRRQLLHALDDAEALPASGKPFAPFYHAFWRKQNRAVGLSVLR
ncbi:MAG: C69 family dipeptidase [Cytophagaceae bacterium]|nr:C69 family dipeptidase [Cytophagaceae bacterium]